MNQVPNMRGPMGLKNRKAKRNRSYIAKIHDLPCCICDGWGLRQLTPTEAHHTRHGRYGQTKRPDDMAIPLCRDHHRGGNGRVSVENDREAFERLFGPDINFVDATRDKIARMK